jgi:hypothetical protein
VLADPKVPDSAHSRFYREVEPYGLHLKNNHSFALRAARSPYTLENLRPQGPVVAQAAHKFTIGAAADRYAHPGAQYLGGLWKSKGSVNDEVLKAPIKQPNSVNWAGRGRTMEKFTATASSAERSAKSSTGTFF